MDELTIILIGLAFAAINIILFVKIWIVTTHVKEIILTMQPNQQIATCPFDIITALKERTKSLNI